MAEREPLAPTSADAASAGDAHTRSDLTRDGLLLAEMAYLQACANQANEDRARVYHYFMAAVGSIAVGLLTANLAEGNPAVRQIGALGFGVLFGLLAWLGYTTLRQLIALRRSWYDASEAMNQIKRHYVTAFPDLKPALRWTDEHLPPLYKASSVSNQLASVVALVMGAAAGAAAYALGLVLGPWAPSLVQNIVAALALAWAIELTATTQPDLGGRWAPLAAASAGLGWLWLANAVPEMVDNLAAASLAVGALVAALARRDYRLSLKYRDEY